MKFRLINTKTNEETICDKITRGGFDYYVSKADIGIRDYFEVDGQLFQCLTSQEADDLAVSNDYPKVIATNNQKIDIPKIADEVVSFEGAKDLSSFVRGYNKAKETYQFTEEDMIEFALWKDENKFSVISTKEDWISELLEYSEVYTTKELLQLWKEQQPKTLYYNA